MRQEILSLTTKTSQELRKMYEKATESKAPPYRREYFIKWLAYRLQEKEYGGLSEKATRLFSRANEARKEDTPFIITSWNEDNQKIPWRGV